MSLQLILGSPGSGKSYTLYQEIIQQSKEHESENYMIIVPEQFTMQTQKDLVSMHPDQGIMNIEILSFQRLAHRIFDELGGNDRQVLDDMGKSMILRKVVEEKESELVLFQSNVRKAGFVSELKSILSEIYQYGIKGDQLGELIEHTKNKPMLHNKIKDLLTVYEGFGNFLKDRYITTEEILDVLTDAVENSDLIARSTICLDGYTGFTPVQYKLIARLLRLSPKVMVTVTLDPREDPAKMDEEFKLFHMSKKTIQKLYEIAEQEGVRVEKAIVLGAQGVPYRFQNSLTLAALERNLFRYPFQSVNGQTEGLYIHEAREAKEEAAFVIREMGRLIKEEGYRYKDMAVVTGDIETYGRILEKECAIAGIPTFIDNKRDILSNPLVECIRGVIGVALHDFSYESVFRLLRCGMLDVEKEEVDLIENYVIALGIRGRRRWSETWTRKYRVRGELDLDVINEIRERIYTCLEPVSEVLLQKEATVKDYATGLYEYLVAEHAAENIEAYSQMFKEKNELQLSKEFDQVYPLVMDLLDRIVELLGEDVMSLQEFDEILASGFGEAKVGLIPPGIDQVVVGDIERTRLKDIKALFFIGVNDGIIPKANNGGGIISDMDRELIAGHGVELAPTGKQNAYTEQFYLYLNLTKPQERLYVTYSKINGEGKSVRPSYLIAKLRKIFPDLKVTEEHRAEEDLSTILSNHRGIGYLGEGLRKYADQEMTDVWKELYSWYLRQPEHKKEAKRLVEGAFYSNEERGLSKAVAHALYGSELTNSVTRLEKYAACAYAHFMTFGLELLERQEYHIAVVDLGNIFHNAIDLFSRKLKESEYNWHTVTDEMRNALVAESVREVTAEYGNTILGSSKRNEYIVNRVERITKRTVWALCEHVKKGVFEPEGFELQFSYLDNLEAVNIPLSDREWMKLRGRIDRLDTYETGDSVYVKVIDYKSGNNSLDILSFYYGLQLQLVVYLGAAMELTQKKHPDKEVIPAGVFYYHIDDPVVEKTADMDVEGAILKELKMNGLVHEDLSIAGMMDQSLVDEEGAGRASAKSLVIPVELSKDGYPTKRSNMASQKQFDAMQQYVRKKITDLGKELIDGSTALNPYKMKNNTACDYCEYKGICGFDTKLPGNTYRNLKLFDKEEVWERLFTETRKEDGKEA